MFDAFPKNAEKLGRPLLEVFLFSSVMLYFALVGKTESHAQELSGSFGGMSVVGDHNGSYSWQIDYRQRVSRNIAWSFMWLNEGHVPGHHRDGFAGQIWGVLPLMRDRLDLALGAGLYNFFDTQTKLAPDGSLISSEDIHNFAAIYSVTATWHMPRHWFFRLTVNRVAPAGDGNIDIVTYLGGVGYWLGSHHPKSETAKMVTKKIFPGARNEIALLAGESVVNIHGGQRDFSAQIEYRRALSAHADWTISYLNEGSGKHIKRNGPVSQLWVMGRFFDERLQVGFGAGVYWTFESSNEIEGWRALSGIVSPTFSYRFTKHWLARVTWNRVISSYDRDADNFLIGLGYVWGG